MKHLLRLREPLLDPSSRLRVVTTRYTGAYSPSHHFLADRPFKAIVYSQLRHLELSCSQFSVQSHYLFQFSVQSRIFSLAFRAVICPQFDIRSHHVSFPSDIQSCIFILAFKTASSVWRSESSFVFSSTFGATMSLFRFTFRVAFSFWRLKPHLQFGV